MSGSASRATALSCHRPSASCSHRAGHRLTGASRSRSWALGDAATMGSWPHATSARAASTSYRLVNTSRRETPGGGRWLVRRRSRSSDKPSAAAAERWGRTFRSAPTCRSTNRLGRRPAPQRVGFPTRTVIVAPTACSRDGGGTAVCREGGSILATDRRRPRSLTRACDPDAGRCCAVPCPSMSCRHRTWVRATAAPRPVTVPDQRIARSSRTERRASPWRAAGGQRMPAGCGDDARASGAARSESPGRDWSVDSFAAQPQRCPARGS